MWKGRREAEDKDCKVDIWEPGWVVMSLSLTEAGEQ